MAIVSHQVRGQGGDRELPRLGMTLVELLVVISIIGILAALLFPALNAARASSRKAACQSNLRQFYIGMMAHADRHGTFCSGAFDWNRDGCVTEVGWVADLVNAGTPVGKMLCPSNPGQISEAYNDLLGLDLADLDPCVDHVGSPPSTAPDGTPIVNPCRLVVETPLAPLSEPRRQLVEEKIYQKFYNTNYTASWFLVRSGALLDASGNLRSDGGGCETSLKARASTFGPLTQARLDSSSIPSSLVPLLGCGLATDILSQTIGPDEAGTSVVKSFTNGPVLDLTMQPPSFPVGTSKTGPAGWWAGWNNTTMQDYRGFAPVHRGAGNVLFADGSVGALLDDNEDGLLNNGFSATPTTGFASDEVEVSEEALFSRWSLRATW
jgi:prepilin-type N-terminal cleavage/methylation domain-containing protein/prepilin-type processing-associated H-X9-DG protein